MRDPILGERILVHTDSHGLDHTHHLREVERRQPRPDSTFVIYECTDPRCSLNRAEEWSTEPDITARA